MDANPEVGICGTWAEEMTAAGKVIPGRRRTYPTRSADIKNGLLSDLPC
jgi:hypothetical protein